MFNIDDKVKRAVEAARRIAPNGGYLILKHDGAPILPSDGWQLRENQLTLDAAESAYRKWGDMVRGIALIANDDFFIFDIDEMDAEFIEKLNGSAELVRKRRDIMYGRATDSDGGTYVEWSQSKTGWHAIYGVGENFHKVRGRKLLKSHYKVDGIAGPMYCHITGDQVSPHDVPRDGTKLVRTTLKESVEDAHPDTSLPATGEAIGVRGLSDARVWHLLHYHRPGTFEACGTTALNTGIGDGSFSDAMTKAVGDLTKISSDPVQVKRMLARSPIVTCDRPTQKGRGEARSIKFDKLFDDWWQGALASNTRGLPLITRRDYRDGYPSIEHGKSMNLVWDGTSRTPPPKVHDGIVLAPAASTVIRPVAPWYDWPANDVANRVRSTKTKDELFAIIPTLAYGSRMLDHVAPILARAIEMGVKYGAPAHTQLVQDIIAQGAGKVTELKNAFNDLYHDFKNHARSNSDRVALITNSRGEPAVHARNAEILIMDDPEMEGVFVMDEFYEDVLIARCPPWIAMADGDIWIPRPPKDIDLLKLMTRLQDQHLPVTIQIATQAAKLVSEYAVQNCAKQDIEAERWDGAPRLDMMMSTHFGCEDTRYNRFIGAKSLIAAVARVYRPGCQVDTVLLLYSADQGRNKTAAIRELFGEDNYGVLAGDYRSKDEVAKTRGKRVIDFSEMEVFTKREMRSANSFVTEREDEYREPYGIKNRVYKRKYVLWGTTNTKQMLSDETGARRYLVGDVTGRCDIAAIKRDRGQLWAEAKYRFAQGERWHADVVEDAWFIEHAAGVAATHTEVGVWDTTVAAYLAYIGHFDSDRGRFIATGTRPAPREFVTPLVILRDAFGFEDARIQPKDNREIGRVLRKFGYEAGTKRYGKDAKDVASGWLIRSATNAFAMQIVTVAQTYGISQTPLVPEIVDLEFIRNEAIKAAEAAKNR